MSPPAAFVPATTACLNAVVANATNQGSRSTPLNDKAQSPMAYTSFTLVSILSSVIMAPRSWARPALIAMSDSGSTPTDMTTMSVGIISPAISTDSMRSLPFILSMPFPNRILRPMDSKYPLMISPMSGSRFRGKGGGLLFVTHTSSPSCLSA